MRREAMIERFHSVLVARCRDQDTWEPQENLQHLEIYKEFWERRKQAKDNLSAKKASKKKTTDSTSEDEGTRANDPFRHLKKMRSELKKRRLEGTSKSKSSQKRTDLYGKVYQVSVWKHCCITWRIETFASFSRKCSSPKMWVWGWRFPNLNSVNFEVVATRIVFLTVIFYFLQMQPQTLSRRRHFIPRKQRLWKV